MITRIQFTVKQGSKIELKAFSRLNRVKCLEHVTNAAKTIGWTLDLKLTTDSRVVAVAPPEPTLNQVISFLMMRGAHPTYFDLTMSDPKEGSAQWLTLIVSVTQPKPGDPSKFIEVLTIVGKQLAHEFSKDGITLRWSRSDYASFEKAIEDAARRGVKGSELIAVAEKHKEEFTF